MTYKISTYGEHGVWTKLVDYFYYDLSWQNIENEWYAKVREYLIDNYRILYYDMNESYIPDYFEFETEDDMILFALEWS
jgi:hypothetical protein